MTIKYAEITIIRNYQDNWYNNMINWLGYESNASENSDIILLFDDETIYDVNNSFKDLNFSFLGSHSDVMPIYFHPKDKINNDMKTYFKRKPVEENNIQKLNFNYIFKFYNKYKQCKFIPSIFNCIYYCYNISGNPEVFSIVKIYSNEDKPRFLLAYDSEEFDKETIIYLIYCIFKNKYNNNVL